MDSCITCRKPRPQPRLRLFCFPYAGRGVSIFRAWPDGLTADVEVCPGQLPGRETRADGGHRSLASRLLSKPSPGPSRGEPLDDQIGEQRNRGSDDDRSNEHGCVNIPPLL